MVPTDPIIDAVNQMKMEIKNKIEFENSTTHNELKNVAFEMYQLNETTSRVEHHVIFLTQKLGILINENSELKQKIELQIQQNVRLEQILQQTLLQMLQQKK